MFQVLRDAGVLYFMRVFRVDELHRLDSNEGPGNASTSLGGAVRSPSCDCVPKRQVRRKPETRGEKWSPPIIASWTLRTKHQSVERFFLLVKLEKRKSTLSPTLVTEHLNSTLPPLVTAQHKV